MSHNTFRQYRNQGKDSIRMCVECKTAGKGRRLIGRGADGTEFWYCPACEADLKFHRRNHRADKDR